jgi:protocatechuate 3,4-dioxygenase beta subunit
MRSMQRRRALKWLGGLSLLPLVKFAACDDSGTEAVSDTDSDGADGLDASDATDTNTSTDTNPATDTSTPETCSRIPTETAGPYPGDGSNGPNALESTSIVRRDIRSSFGALTGTAEGVPLTVRLRVVQANGACASLEGYAVYVWQCDRDANYSMYTLTTQNYLRGVQVSDADGFVTFDSIFPACYAGRWPHIHFEVYPSLASATNAANKVATSQLALPQAACELVYATTGYAQSVTNLAQITLSSDTVFRDGVDQQMATVTGDVNAGFLATLDVAITT